MRWREANRGKEGAEEGGENQTKVRRGRVFSNSQFKIQSENAKFRELVRLIGNDPEVVAEGNGRVKSKKIAESIRRNILIHGSSDGAGEDGGTEMALRNRDGRKKEVVNLRNVVLRQQNELRAKVLELSIEEAERKRMLD
ncbi:hypothetical protein Scep_004502 [Stephania cephalantha]|uniref:Uncharacterized protein n=1 Tax=Stephania cephalantha TaxID=152367 RepID=A0AAP0PVH3_9MAGN